MIRQGFWDIRWLVGGLLLVFGAATLFLPQYFASRAYFLSLDPAANLWLMRAIGVAFMGLAFTLVLEPEETRGRTPLGATLGAGAASLIYFLCLTQHLADWWIDDAGITFAYSRSLSEGLGLVAQPWMPPEEGYSSSIWMLLLALMAEMGADIPLAAKALGITFTAVAICVCVMITAREISSPLAVMICSIGIACAPTVVWAVSGQEHALQALFLLAVVLSVYATRRWRWPVALLLALLVLTRPEAPIIVIAVFCTAVILTRRAEGALINLADAAIALVPFMAFVGLIAFRVLYFGDPMPNPFYAKSSGTGFLGLFNPLGGGWTYILSGLRNTALFFVLWLAFVVSAARQPDWRLIGMAILIGHVVFVVWAKGDWMGQYRFLMPVLPIALLLAAGGLQVLSLRRARSVFSVLAIMVLVHTTILNLAVFKTNPTTPMAAVTQVGNTFRDLADRLGVADPVLAHHDAGGISYHRMVRLVDLGGLVNRTIAQNMEDGAFLTTYLLEEVQPDFFFGARNFATASGFTEASAFERDYVQIEFIDKPYMTSALVHMRRDILTPVPGVALETDATGAIVVARVAPNPVATQSQ